MPGFRSPNFSMPGFRSLSTMPGFRSSIRISSLLLFDPLSSNLSAASIHPVLFTLSESLISNHPSPFTHIASFVLTSFLFITSVRASSLFITLKLSLSLNSIRLNCFLLHWTGSRTGTGGRYASSCSTCFRESKIFQRNRRWPQFGHYFDTSTK